MIEVGLFITGVVFGVGVAVGLIRYGMSLGARKDEGLLWSDTPKDLPSHTGDIGDDTNDYE